MNIERNQATRDIGGLESIVVGTLDEASAVVVLLHGYGMDPRALAPFAQALNLPAVFVLPRGPYPADPDGYAWWPIDASERANCSGGPPRELHRSDWPQRPLARERLAAHLLAIRRIIGDRPLIVGGFSQGGMLAIDLLLASAEAPALVVDGLVIFSSSRIAFEEWRPNLARLRDLPVLLSHGRADAELAFAAGEALRDMFEAAGARLSWVPFDEGHLIPLLVWRHFRRFVTIVQDPDARNSRPGA